MATGATDDVKINFGANYGDVTKALQDMQNLFGEFGKRLAQISAIVAGGAAFKSFIDAAVSVNSEAKNMSRTLGITADEAGILSVALDDIGSSSEAYVGAFTKFARQLRTNGDEFRALGVDVDGLKKGTKSSTEVFQESLAIVAKYKPGLDQTQVAMKLFGRSVEDVQQLLKLNGVNLDEVRKKAEALNLTITAEGQRSASEYKHAIRDVVDVLTGFKKTVGEGVIPVFTEMAQSFAELGPTIIQYTKVAVDGFVSIWRTGRSIIGAIVTDIAEFIGSVAAGFKQFFGEDGPSAMEVFRNSMAVIHITVISFGIGIREIFNGITTTINLLGNSFQTLGEVISHSMSGDWSGAAQAMRAGMARQNQILQEGIDKAVKIASDGQKAIQAAAMAPLVNPQEKTPAGSAGGTGTKTFDSGEQQQHASALNALLKAKNEAALALQLEYLREQQAINDDAFKQQLVSVKKYYEDKLQIELSAIDKTVEAKRKEIELAKVQADAAKKQGKTNDELSALAQIAKLTGDINVLEARRSDSIRANAAAYREEERSRQNALANTRATRDNSRAQDDVAAERARIDQMQALRQIDAEQAFALQKQAEQRSYSATEQFLEAKHALIREGDLQAQVELNAQIEEAKRAHEARMTQIEYAAQQERTAATRQVQQGVQGGFAQMLNDLMSGTKKLSDAFRGFAINVATQFQNLIAQKFAEKLFGGGTAGGDMIGKLTQPIMNGINALVEKWGWAQIKMTASTVAGTVQRVAAEAWAGAQSILITAATAIKRIAIYAWTAAAAVYQSIAAIPYVGPFLAPAAAIAAGVAVLAFAKNIASAEGGWWEIPGDQIAQVHKNEMVLPAKEAQGLRNMVSGGKGGGGSGMNITIHAIDGQSVKRVLMENQTALVDAMKRADRDFRK